MKSNRFNQLADILGYSFNDPKLLQRALTHRSADEAHNETLEFLGDSVLSVIVSSYLFNYYPNADEGELTVLRIRIVNNNLALFKVAEHINFEKFIVVDKSFVTSNKKAWQNLLANTLEALIGAIYLDGGLAAATDFFDQHFIPLLNDLIGGAHSNFKSKLQEFLQGQSREIPRYETVEVSGQDHAPAFTVKCYIDSLKKPVVGSGKTVKEAEQVAAGKAYELLCGRNS